MPLHAKIYINDRLIDEVHIGRMSGGSMSPDAVNTYKVVVGEVPTSTEEWLEGEEFTHRYGDGALVCVQKGITAYELANSLETTND